MVRKRIVIRAEDTYALIFFYCRQAASFTFHMIVNTRLDSKIKKCYICMYKQRRESFEL